MGSKVKASIDIGSNTVLLLIGEPKQHKKVRVIYEEQHAPRLGKGVDAEKNLANASMQRVIEVLHTYKSIIKEYQLAVSEAKVVATSAVRDANNRQCFRHKVGEQTGFRLQILSGEEEAELTFLGAQSVLDLNGDTNMAAIDIGGGSTEIAIGNGATLADRHSFNIGSVRFTERYLQNSPPSNDELKNCRRAIVEALESRSFKLGDDIKLIGVSGTVTSLLAIKAGLQTYQPHKLNGRILSIEDISSHISTFSTITAQRLLEDYPNILAGRADVFLAGLLILEGFMKCYRISEIIVSTGGIRHGALLAK